MKPCDWKYIGDTKLIYAHIKGLINHDSTILTLMKESLKTNKSNGFCYDSIFGVQSRNDFLIKAYLIADLIKKMP
jgi:hypothetical protein